MQSLSLQDPQWSWTDLQDPQLSWPHLVLLITKSQRIGRPSGDCPAGTCPESPETLSTGPPVKPGLDRLSPGGADAVTALAPKAAPRLSNPHRSPGLDQLRMRDSTGAPAHALPACHGACAVAVSGPRGRVLPRSPRSPALARAVLPRPSCCPRHGPQLRLRCAS